ncbi:hypothetical protein LJC19_07140 [Oxalobacter sp. OttesenSCG-928-P03]|nr:hypothetical protein [Oxalobacter sp. OttesenSCG-928-P03]
MNTANETPELETEAANFCMVREKFAKMASSCECLNETKKAIQNYPLASVAVAFVAGCILGRIIK